MWPCQGAVHEHEKVPHALPGDHGVRLLIHAERFDRMERSVVHVFALHQPVEEAVEPAILGVSFALGQLLGRNVLAFAEPPKLKPQWDVHFRTK